jgi:predicted  nucleic acid-binding Zn-ribbon protein
LRNEYAQKEDLFRSQIERLEKKLQQTEAKNEEMLLSTKDATAPLLLQIERLEADLRFAKSEKEGQEMLHAKRIQMSDRENVELNRKISEIEQRELSLRDECQLLQNKLNSLSAEHSIQQQVSLH